MRFILVLLAIATAAATDWAGTWTGNGLVVVLSPVANGWSGTATYEGETSPLQAIEQNGKLVGQYVEAGETYAFAAKVEGTALVIDTADGDRYVLARSGAAAQPVAPPPAAPAQPAVGAPVATNDPLTVAALIGTWIGPQGSTVLRADGTGASGKDEFRWSLRDNGLRVENAQGFLQFPTQLRGNLLVLGTGPSVELQRVVGAAGTWYGWDGSVDPTMVISVSHHIALLPDGSVAYAKGELDATRKQGWFNMRRENDRQQTVGTWSQQGTEVQFSLGSSTYRATFNEEKQTLTVRGMGQVNEGADVDFTRE